MALGNFTSNQGTQTPIVVDTIGGGSVIAMQKLDISPIGAAGTPWQGGVTGTINSGSIIITTGTLGTLSSIGTLPNLPGGSIVMTNGTIGTISGIGTLTNIGTLPNISGGTLNLVTTVTNLSNGTIQNSGTTTGIGTVTNLGSVSTIGTLPALTISAGSLIGTVVNNGGSVGITDNTNLANVISPGTANAQAGQNLLLTAGGGYTTATITLNSGTPNTQWFDMLNYAWVSVEILTNTTPATLTFQTSGDASETNVNSVPLMNVQNTGSNGQLPSLSTSSATASFHGPRSGRYFRVSSNNGAGSTTLVLTFYTIPSAVYGLTPQNVGSTSVNSNGTITTSSSSITSNNINTSIGGFVPISIHGTYSGVSFSISVSDDGGTTFYNVSVYDATNNVWIAPGGTITPGTNASMLYWIPTPPTNSGSKVKVTASAYTSGTATVNIGGASATTLSGSFMSQIMDAAGNNRGANVDSNHNLNVNIGAGNLQGGTINVVSSLTTGSINILSGTQQQLNNLGTLQAGTINTGTFQINQIPTIKTTSFGTLGTAGAGTVFGTIQGTVGSGTEIIATDWSIIVTAGTPTISLGFGTSGGSVPFLGTGVIDQGAFAPGGGLAKAVDNALNSGTNGALYYGITAGSALIKISYQTVATTV